MFTIKPRLEVFRSSGGGGGGSGNGPPTCFLAGTRIAAADGAVCVEDLSVGSVVLTASGEARPVRWLGHRGLDSSRYADPATVWPICIKAGAFADQQPTRDLFVSPAHCILVADVLIPAEKLLNGATIAQVPRERLEYWHVELDSHDILLSEGLPTESYLDSGNRTAFVNGGAYLEAFPDFRPKHWSDTCVPLVMDGAKVEQAKAALLARAQALGYVMTSDPDLHLLADGQRIESLRLSDTRVAFVVPAEAANIALHSRSFAPAHMQPDSQDKRSLGVCVQRLQLDGNEISLDDEALFANGWHGLESGPGGTQWRWCQAQAALPPGTRLVVIDVRAQGQYWLEPGQDTVAALVSAQRR
jgi:Hint domain